MSLNGLITAARLSLPLTGQDSPGGGVGPTPAVMTAVGDTCQAESCDPSLQPAAGRRMWKTAGSSE